MKIIFLDMDGVLNSDPFIIGNSRNDGSNPMDRWPGGHINPVNVKQFDRLVRRTGAQVVLSSAWRTHIELDALHALLVERGYTGPKLIGKTTSSIVSYNGGNYVPRGAEIQNWLDNCEVDIESFVILDDMEDMIHLSDRFVQTDSDHGLTAEDVLKAVEILGTSCRKVA